MGVPAGPGRAVGARVLRREDRRLVTGRGNYVSDVVPAGTLHAAFVRSEHGHADLVCVDADAAGAMPGVAAVLRAQELRGVAASLRATSKTPGYQECDTPILADGVVRMVGEPIAIVVAESRYQAEDAAERVAVTYAPRPLVGGIEAALRDGAPLVHDEVAGNLYNAFATASDGVDDALTAADELVELEIRQQRYCAAAMEPRVAVAAYDPGRDALTAWLSTQVPHIARTGLARHLGLPETRVRVIAPDIGGGFGPKCVLYTEDVAIAAASRVLGRPVRWVSDRVEDLQTTVHGREQVCRLRVGASADGRVAAVSAAVYADNGAYAPWPYTAALDSGQASDIVTGPYDVSRYARSVHAVATNKAPMGPYRGVGRVVACLAIERAMDELAARCGLDRLEVRRRNIVRAFPHETPTGLRYESGDYAQLLDLVEEGIDWHATAAEDARLRRDGRARGLGIALVVEQSAYGAQSIGERRMDMTFGYDTALLRMEPDGRLRVAVGLHNHGQGHETTIAQIAADELGLTVDDVEVVYGDTAIVPYGMGTWASRSTVACGGATIVAGRELAQRIRELAADMLEADPGDLELSGGAVFVRGAPGRGVALADVAKRAIHEPHLLPAGVEPGLEVTRRFLPPDPGTFSSTAHAAHVEVDLELGTVEILRYVVAEDCGTVVNPTIVEGQVHGGVAQGIGGAFLERLVYDDAGSLATTSFLDYLMPLAPNVPRIEVHHLESPAPDVPGGFKGMGEGGAISAPATLVSAVNDALRPLGVVADHTPLTPEWVLEAIGADPRAALAAASR